MPPVKLLVATTFPQSAVDELDKAGADVEVTVLDDSLRRLLRTGIRDSQTEESATLRRLIGQSEVIYFAGIGVGPELHELATQARWLHTSADGVDNLLESGYGRGSYVFTNSAGPHAISIAEYIVMQSLMLIKGAAGYVRRQTEHKWERRPASEASAHSELNGLTAGIVGMGAIGVAAAERLRALGCTIVATRRSATAREQHAGPAHELVPASDLDYLLGKSDIVVLTLPLTRESRHLIDAAALRAMKPSAYLINISRGGVIDEAALIEALRERRIAGAALDVFEQEPLPADSPLWDLATVNVTPHISTTSERFAQRQTDLFLENLRRYLAHEPLLNVVDPDRGY